MKITPYSCLLILAIGSLIPASLLAASESDEIKSPPNIVVVLGDDMLPHYLGAYGGDAPTPNLDRLASNGIVFDRAYCVSSMCTPSRYSLLTGNYPGRCQSPSFIEDNPKGDTASIAWNTELTMNEVNMGRIFTNLGYQTAVVGKWHLSGHPYDIEVPEISPDADVTDPSIIELLEERQEILEHHVKTVSGFEQARSILWANFDVAGTLEKQLRVHNYEWILNGALDFLDSVDKDRPFLMYFASTSVHGPVHMESLKSDLDVSPGGKFELPSSYYPSRSDIMDELANHSGSHSENINAGMIQLDHQVGGIVKKLEERGLTENTLFIFLADHGVEPGKATSYIRGNKIPFFATWLDRDAEGTRSEQVVQVCDVFPTVYEMVTGEESSENFDIDGISFAPTLRGEQSDGREFAYLENGYTRSIVKGDLHYIAWRYPESILKKLRSGELEEAPDHLGFVDNEQASVTIELIPSYWDPDQLYNLKNDPYEMENLYSNAEYKGALEELQSDLAKVLATRNHPFSLNESDFQRSAAFDRLKQPRIDRGTGHVYWYTPGQLKWPPNE